MTQTMPIRV